MPGLEMLHVSSAIHHAFYSSPPGCPPSERAEHSCGIMFSMPKLANILVTISAEELSLVVLWCVVDE